MQFIKIDDILFSHGEYSTDIQKSKYIKWDRTFILGNENLAVYTDNSLSRVNGRVKNKIAWLLESPAVSSHWHDWIKDNSHLFNLVLTNNKDLLDLGDRYQFLPTGGCWIKEEDQKIWNKTKLVSIIASNKNWTDGHKMRQEVLKYLKNSKIEVYGRGHNEIGYKLEGLKDYKFSIVVENTKKDYYFTEKLIDCFACGTIPIYWGCPSINKFFDERGILMFGNIRELNNILNNINDDLYYEKLEYIKNNLEKSKEYMIAEDYMWEKYLHKYV